MSKDKILNLISKLKRLSENNNSVEEASLAAARMQELIEQHNIGEAELDISDDNSPEEFTKTEFYKEKGKNITRWKLSLAGKLANLNTCKIVFRKGYKDRSLNIVLPGKITIYGQPSKVAIVNYMFQYLVREIERLCKLSIKQGYGSGKGYANSFKVGAAYTIMDRLKEMQQEVRSECSENALVRFDRDKTELEKYLRNFNFRLAKVDNTASSKSGFTNGVHAGKRINLNTGKEIGPGYKSLKS